MHELKLLKAALTSAEIAERFRYKTSPAYQPESRQTLLEFRFLGACGVALINLN